MQQINDLLERGVINIIPSKDQLKKALESGKKLNIYLGIDPTATRIHLGHAVILRKLEKLAQLGHNVTFLIGDFTALIGDTSDKESERPVLTSQEIEHNFQTYKQQASKILDFNKVNVHYNSKWLKKLGFSDIISLTKHFSVNDFISRELIKKRLNEGKHVKLDEVLYPIMQGYDSYFMNIDLQLGGADQTFNMQAGRTLQKSLRNKESFVLATDYLPGTDGRKMSKSWGNAIWLDDTPSDMYAKVMAINDDLIITYFKLATNVPNNKITEVEQRLQNEDNPRDIKKELAFEVVCELYNTEEAELAKNHFEKTVQNKEQPVNIKLIKLPKSYLNSVTIIDALIKAELTVSKAEARRITNQGGIKVNGENLTSLDDPLDSFIKNGKVLLQRGKLKAAEIQIES